MDLANSTNLENARIDRDSMDLLITAFKLYEIAKMDNNVYRIDEDLKIIRHLIKLYYKLVNPNYNNMIFNFRRRYVSNELLVEKNDTPEERRGLNLVYDFIQDFDIEHDDFNIFMTALQIHALLYKPRDEKNARQVDEDRERAKQLEEEARKERSLEKLKEAKEMLESTKFQKFGGQLRTESVVMNDFHAHIPDAKEARDKIKQNISTEKREEKERALNKPEIISYKDNY